MDIDKIFIIHNKQINVVNLKTTLVKYKGWSVILF